MIGQSGSSVSREQRHHTLHHRHWSRLQSITPGSPQQQTKHTLCTKRGTGPETETQNNICRVQSSAVVPIVFYELSRQKLAGPRSPGLYGSTMQTCWLSGLDPNVYVNITGGLRGIIIMSRPGGAVRQHPVPAPHTRRLWIPCGETLPARHSLWPPPPRKNWTIAFVLIQNKPSLGT